MKSRTGLVLRLKEEAELIVTIIQDWEDEKESSISLGRLLENLSPEMSVLRSTFYELDLFYGITPSP